MASPAMAAAAQKPKAEHAPFVLRMPFVRCHRDPPRLSNFSKLCEDLISQGFGHIFKIMRDPSVPTIERVIEAWNRMEEGLRLSLAGFTQSPTARVIKAANPGDAARVIEAANPGGTARVIEAGAKVVLVLDSGASMHAVSDARILQGIRLLSFDNWATLPDNYPRRIVGLGSIQMDGFSIPNVRLVEGLRMNLISVGQLDRDHGMCCCFHGGQCEVMRPGGNVVGGAILEEAGEYFGLYVLRFLEVPQPEE